MGVLAFGYIAECVLHVDNCDWLTFVTVKQESIVIGPNSGHSNSQGRALKPNITAKLTLKTN